MEKFKEGQSVIYQGYATHIEKIFDDNTANIKNPFWDYDDEFECVNYGFDYNVTYWINVKLSELKEV